MSQSSQSPPRGMSFAHGFFNVGRESQSGSETDTKRSNSSTTFSRDSWASRLMSEEEFFRQLKSCIFDTSQLDNFMENAEHHPLQGWHKALLFVHEIKASSHVYEISAPMVESFLDELLQRFPDVLQRMLLRGAFEIPAAKSPPPFGPLHVAVLCCEPRVVELLTRFESKDHIKKCIVDLVKQPACDELKAIERALLWSNLRDSVADATNGQGITEFMKKFRMAIRLDDTDQLRNLIGHAYLFPMDAWRAVLLWASASGENQVVRMFKEQSLQLFTDIREASEREGLPPLRTTSMKARELLSRGKQEIVELVVGLVDLADQPFYREILAKNLHYRVGQGWTALHVATILRSQAMVSLLIESYDSHQTWQKMADRLNSLQKSADACSKSSSTDAKESSVRSGGDSAKVMYSYSDFSDDSWWTPLHYATINEDEEIMGKLLAWETFKSHLNDFSLFMCTCFHLACTKEDGAGMLELLMRSQIMDVNAQDCCFFTPLHWAVYTGSTSCIRFLLSHAQDANRPVKVSEEDFQGRQAFAISMENKTWKLLTFLPQVKEEIERLYRDRQVYVDASNAVSVGAALIAGVTFAGWALPVATSPSTSSHEMHYVEVYWVCNSLSFFFSIAALMAGIAAVLPMEDKYIGKAVKTIREWLILTSFLMLVSLVFTLGAFTSAGMASLDPSAMRLKRGYLITSSIGCCICATVGIFFCRKLYTINQGWSQRYAMLLLKMLCRVFYPIRVIIGVKFCSVISLKEVEVREDWNVIGKKWKGREAKWKKLRGVHHLGQISTAVCRRYALHNGKSTHYKLLDECHKLQEVGTLVAEEIATMAPCNNTGKDRFGSQLRAVGED